MLLAKVVISVLMILAITEASKRVGTFWGGVIASLPLVSILSFIWLYAETKDTMKVAELSWNILWLVIPSLSLFIALPILLRRGVPFGTSLAGSVAIMAIAYFLTASVARRFGVVI